MISVTDIGVFSNGPGSGTITASLTVPQGAAIFTVASLGGVSYNSSTLSDATNGNHVKITNVANGGSAISFGGTQLWYFPNSAALSAVTLTFTKAQSVSGAMSVFYATGLTNNPLDSGTISNTFGTTGGVSLPSGAPSALGELFIAAIGDGTGYTQDTGNGWSAPFDAQVPNFNIGGGHLINNGSNPVTFAPTGVGSDWGAVIAGFFPSSPPVASPAGFWVDIQIN
jgi:hypothetical protein